VATQNAAITAARIKKAGFHPTKSATTSANAEASHAEVR
jgi:hypothetical protein